MALKSPFAPFLSEEDYGDLRWYLEEYMDLPDGGAIVRAKRIEERLEEWGRKLHDAIFGAKENRGLQELLLSAPAPRELTIATEDPALLRLPWELMADNAGSLAQRVSIRRQLENAEEVASLARLGCPFASSTSSAVRTMPVSSIPGSPPRRSSMPSILSAPTCGWISAAHPPWHGWKRC